MLIGLLVVFLLSWRGVRGQIKVLSPEGFVNEFKSLAPDAIIRGSTATFGAPSYGESFAGVLCYADSESTHCAPDYGDAIHSQLQRYRAEGMRPLFVLKRGNCTFVQKVKVAQDLGAQGALVVDQQDSPWDRGDLQRVIMADDGQGAQITIPSVLISKEDGAAIIHWINEHSLEGDGPRPIIAEMEWTLPTNKVVSVDFWTDTGNVEGMNFLQGFAPFARSLRGHIQFTAHYFVFGLPADPSKLCVHRQPEFCADSPDSIGAIKTNPILGRDVLFEDLRQICLANVTSAPTQPGGPLHSDVWWRYVERFPKECPLDGSRETSRFGEPCSYKLLKSLGVNVAAVQWCMNHNWRDLLQREKEDRAWSVLALRINGMRFSGNLDPYLAAKAACAAFESQPGACSRLQTSKNSGISPGWLILILVSCVGVVVGGVYVYQLHMRRSLRATLRHEVMLEVKSQMQEYHQLADDPLIDFPGGIGNKRSRFPV